MRTGFSRRDITPDRPMRMAGFDARKGESEGTLDPLYLSLVLTEGAAIVSLDLLGADARLCGRIRRAVSENAPVAQDAVLVCATHTHSAPSCAFLESDVFDEKYASFLVRAAGEAALEASRDMRPARVAYSETRVAGIASVRNAGRQGANYGMRTGVLRLSEARIVLFRCHPTVLNETNRLYSRDLPGACASAMAHGEKAMFLNGCCADLSTRYTRRASSPDELARLGRLFAQGLPDASEELDAQEARVQSADISLPGAKGFSDAERTRLLAELAQKKENCADEAGKREYASRMLVLQRPSYGVQPDGKVRLSRMDLGRMRLLFLPFEVRVGPGEALEEELSQKTGGIVRVVGYAGGYESYLPSGRALDADSSYEDVASRYAPEAAHILWDGVRNLALAL